MFWDKMWQVWHRGYELYIVTCAIAVACLFLGMIDIKISFFKDVAIIIIAVIITAMIVDVIAKYGDRHEEHVLEYLTNAVRDFTNASEIELIDDGKKARIVMIWLEPTHISEARFGRRPLTSLLGAVERKIGIEDVKEWNCFIHHMTSACYWKNEDSHPLKPIDYCRHVRNAYLSLMQAIKDYNLLQIPAKNSESEYKKIKEKYDLLITELGLLKTEVLSWGDIGGWCVKCPRDLLGLR